MTLVVDASFLVAALIDTGRHGSWATDQMHGATIVGPHLLPIEVASVLRRAAIAGDISPDVATLAHADLLDLPLRLLAYDLVADRAWQLRGNIGIYDACYVAIAEELDAPLATLDLRLARAPGPRCTFAVPPAAS